MSAKPRTTKAPDAASKRVGALLKKHGLPDGVHGFEIEYGEDSVGNPATWVWLIVDDDLKPSKKKIRRFVDLSTAVTRDLWAAFPDRRPYVHFRAAA